MEYSRQSLYLADVASKESANYVIEDSTFEDCKLRGPAVLALLEDTTASSGEIDIPNYDPQMVGILMESDRRVLPVGVIAVRRTTFTNCSFEGVSFFGHSDQIHGLTDKFLSPLRDAKAAE